MRKTIRQFPNDLGLNYSRTTYFKYYIEVRFWKWLGEHRRGSESEHMSEAVPLPRVIKPTLCY